MRKCLLIIEDEEGMLEGHKKALMRNYDIFLVSKADKAADLIFYKGHTIDQMIIGSAGHDRGVIELLKRLRDINHWIPAVIVTDSLAHKQTLDKANLSFCRYIQKPFDIDLLKAAIEGMLRDYEYCLSFNITPKLMIGKDSFIFSPWIFQTLEHIHRSFHKDFMVINMAKKLGVSKRHLERVFKKECGIPPGVYTIRLRVEVAKRLLQNTQYSIAKIMELIGLTQQRYFNDNFRRIVGVLPSEFRKNRNLHGKEPIRMRSL